MKSLLAFLLSSSLVFSQTVVVPIPGDDKQGGGGGGGGVGAVLAGLVIGGLLTLILSKVASAGAPSGESSQRLTFVPGLFIVVFKGRPELSSVGEVLDVESLEDISFALIKSDESFKEFEKKAGALSEVLFIQPQYVYELFSEQLEGRQYYLKEAKPCGAEDRVIAILDTGVDTEHPDLRGAFLRVENFLSSPYGAEEHGTAVASLIGARRNGVGMLGVAYESKLVSLRVCEEGRCFSYSIAKALAWAYRNRPHIINMSFGLYGEDRLVNLLLERLNGAGVKMTAPVGNRDGPIPFPARSPYVISVAGDCFPQGLCQKAKTRMSYRDLLVALPGGSYGIRNGTSFSSALMAGRLACQGH